MRPDLLLNSQFYIVSDSVVVTDSVSVPLDVVVEISRKIHILHCRIFDLNGIMLSALAV